MKNIEDDEFNDYIIYQPMDIYDMYMLSPILVKKKGKNKNGKKTIYNKR